MAPARALLVAAIAVAVIAGALIALHRRGAVRLAAGHAGLLASVATAGAAGAQALPPPPPTVLGINLAPIAGSVATMPFANLAIGSDWYDEGLHKLTDAQVDKDGNLLSTPTAQTKRYLTVPPTGPEGIDIHCSFTGSGSLWMHLNPDRGRAGPHSLDVHVVADHGKTGSPMLVVEGFDPKKPLRDLDCRDKRVDRAARFRPEALRPLRGFGVVRFMDWQNTNANVAVRWADRRQPGALRVDRDGIALEDMLAIARAMNADPWFTVPWNADDDYITRFAQLVRADLPAGRSVYVEVGNEVWNTGFPVAKQAIAEGLARKLSADPGEAGLRRYAQRTAEVMRLWEAAFSGRQGLVRVIATNNSWSPTAEIALSFGDTARHVDALATAPYFGDTLPGPGNTRDKAIALLEAALPKTLGEITANRRVAVAHGKRYIAYEGGPSLAVPMQNDVTEAIQHDEALYGLTRRFLDGWAARSGDVLCLFDSVARPSSWGMWGLAEWEDDTPAQAPKLRAAQDFMISHRTPAAPTSAGRPAIAR